MNTSAQVELTKFTYTDHNNKNHLNMIKYITYYKKRLSYQNNFLHHCKMLLYDADGKEI
jgi:hypothetical protein